MGGLWPYIVYNCSLTCYSALTNKNWKLPYCFFSTQNASTVNTTVHERASQILDDLVYIQRTVQDLQRLRVWQPSLIMIIDNHNIIMYSIRDMLKAMSVNFKSI